MKLFENIAEYQAFKRKYEMMGQLEDERLLAVARDPSSFPMFHEFLDEVLEWPVDPEIRKKVRELELKDNIELHRLLRQIPIQTP